MSERKEKIKSIAIVFLSIMLVLTFFSNTIMNYSLVEVSTQAIYGGSITTKVRGSGMVEALEGVSIEADIGRKIETINVKTGREVEPGEVLFVLGAGESEALKGAKEAYEAAKNAYEIAILDAGLTVEERKVIESGNFGSLTDKQNELANTKKLVEQLQSQIDTMEKDVEKLLNERNSEEVSTERIEEINYHLGEYGWKLELLKAQLAQAQEDAASADKFREQINLYTLYKTYCDASETVKELQGEDTGTEIKAPMAGTITQINYYAGQTIKEENVVMQLKPENEAYTMQFTVSQAQSRRIKVGDPAEILYNWSSDEITASVTSVQRDPMSRESYVVTLELYGDVSVGDTYTVSIGQQSSNYDYVVPTSCIREDSNGKFILTIESKSTPLGNRYYARRTNVEVITSDDSQSAITGAIDDFAYVITTTTKPVAENQQVRLAE